MRNIKEYQTTNIDSVYRKTRKEYLVSTGKIYCGYCKYHKTENCDKTYGGFLAEGFQKGSGIIYPPWKLVSTNKKQWMPKNKVNIVLSEGFRGRIYHKFDIKTKNKKYKDTNFKDLYKRSYVFWQLKVHN